MEGSGLGRLYADGEVVVRQGETGDCMYRLEEGQLEVVTGGTGGRPEVQIRVMEKGAIFGEMAIFEKEVRSATVRALGAARVLTIDKKTFLRRVQEDPSLALNLLRMMSHRIRNLTSTSAERRKAKDRRRGERRSGRDRRDDGE
jgi:CRP-like cAMP-binding protein